MKKILTSLAIVITLGGCSDPKEANNSNFEEVINKYLLDKKENITCTRVGTNFPVDNRFGFEQKYLNRYAESGLLSVISKDIEEKDFLTGKMKKKTKLIYNLTEKGEKYIKDGKFCFGTPVVDKINSFTEPTAFMGKTVSEVRYQFVLDDIPSWYVPKKQKEKKVLLYLSSNGWEFN